MESNEHVDFFKKSLTGIIPPIDGVTSMIDKLRRLIDPSKLSIQDRSDRYLILSMYEDLMELKRKIEHLNSPIEVEGTIGLDESGQYAINGRSLESGSKLEILMLDEATEGCWIFAEAIIDYWNEDYYFAEYPSIPLNGTRARLRESILDKEEGD